MWTNRHQFEELFSALAKNIRYVFHEAYFLAFSTKRKEKKTETLLKVKFRPQDIAKLEESRSLADPGGGRFRPWPHPKA